ncbi:MAG: DUF177 domain-containing protein [Clostridiales bacterium]|nr:DUF177 domain-containing protein [Clostridiales bacterium]
MLKIDISDILVEVGSSKDFSGWVEIGNIPFGHETILFRDPLQMEGTVVNLGELILLRAHLGGAAALQCGVCLEHYDYIVDYDIEVNLKAISDGDNPDIYTYANESIELGDIVISEFLLRLPIQRKCSQGCRGLCTQCGTNLNIKECKCYNLEDQTIDPRLEVMKKIFADRDGEV